MYRIYTLFLVLTLIGSLDTHAQPSAVTFTNRTTDLLGSTGGSYEDCAVDMNGDYLDDIVFIRQDGMEIYYQDANGNFSSQNFPMNFQNLPSWSVCAGDLDGNGHTDLLFGGGTRVSFIMANADGTAYTEDLKPDYIFSQRSTMADIDNDGDLDAFVCHDVDQSHPYRNDGLGNMIEDQSLIETANRPGNYAAIWVDYDNDRDIDLYITKCKQGSSSGDIDRTNLLYQNNGDGTFTEVGEAANMADNAQSWATVFEDFDNDGDFDAFIVNHTERNRLMRNNGDGTFTDIIEGSGIAATDLGAWENAAGDFNNDGFVDIFSELNRELYLNNGDFTFTAQELSFDDGGIGDFNDDGFLDVISEGRLMINDGVAGHNYIKINTRGILSNLNGIGARVEIYGSWGRQIREIRSGQSFSPMSSLCAHFGLGTATEVDSLIVLWPSGATTLVEQPEINTAHVIVESSCLLPTDITTLTTEGETTLCPGETLLISATEGYEYQWSNGAVTSSIEVEGAGSYRVTLTDDEGCIGISNVVSTSVQSEPQPVVAAVDILDPALATICEGDAVTLTVSAGANPVWSNGMTGSSISVSASGAYTVTVDGNCIEEGITSAPYEVNVVDVAAPDLVEIEYQGDEDQYTLVVTGENVQWYDAADSSTPVATGNIYQTPAGLTDDLLYYVEDQTVIGGGAYTGAKPNYLGGGGLSQTGGYNLFDAYETFILKFVLVNVPLNSDEGIRTVQLVNSQEEVLEETTFDLGYGDHILELDWIIPPGVDYSLRCVEENLYRNNEGVSYPYAIGPVGQVHNSLYGDRYYYYFYNWQIELPGVTCTSERVEVALLISDTDAPSDVLQWQIFPNPATTSVEVSIRTTGGEGTYQVGIFDLHGKVVVPIVENGLARGIHTTRLATDQLSSGIYLIGVRLNNQWGYQKLVVQ